MSFATAIVTTGNRIATIKKRKIGRYPEGITFQVIRLGAAREVFSNLVVKVSNNGRTAVRREKHLAAVRLQSSRITPPQYRFTPIDLR